MKTKDQRILSFILDEHPKTVKQFIKKNLIPHSVQNELFENYPETFKMIAEEIEICEDVLLKMITSQELWLPIIMKKHLTFKEQVFFVRHHPEKVKEYQDFLLKNEDEMYDSLCPSAEEEYFKIKQNRTDLPEIEYFWHPEFTSNEELFDDDEYVDVI